VHTQTTAKQDQKPYSGPTGADTPTGLEPTYIGSESQCPKLLRASGAITATDIITIELLEADETPAVVIIRWPVKPTILHPRRFPSGAETNARIFAAAVVALAQVRRTGDCEGSTQRPEQ
jgi:hypothetical protein